jgi:hypothetical protein
MWFIAWASRSGCSNKCGEKNDAQTPDHFGKFPGTHGRGQHLNRMGGMGLRG